MNDAIAAAITQLDDQRTRITQAIDILRGLNGAGAMAFVGVPGKESSPRKTPRPPVTQKPAARHGDPDDAAGHSAAILKYLQAHGPTKTITLVETIGVQRHVVRLALNAMADKGLVHSTGATASLRWHLGAADKRKLGRPAKEAP